MDNQEFIDFLKPTILGIKGKVIVYKTLAMAVAVVETDEEASDANEIATKHGFRLGMVSSLGLKPHQSRMTFLPESAFVDQGTNWRMDGDAEFVRSRTRDDSNLQ